MRRSAIRMSACDLNQKRQCFVRTMVLPKLVLLCLFAKVSTVQTNLLYANISSSASDEGPGAARWKGRLEMLKYVPATIDCFGVNEFNPVW